MHFESALAIFFCIYFLNKGNKVKINKWDYIKLKDFRTAKEMVNRMKRQSKEWEKIFANHISEKKLVSNYMRDSYNSVAENKQTKTNNLNKNGQRS